MKGVVGLSIITFLEGIRSRSVFGIVLFSLFMLGLNVAIAGFFMRELGKVTVDMNLSAISFAGLLLVFFVGLSLISKDIEKKTIHLVLSKPISREQYMLGKFIGIQLFVLASLLVLLVCSCSTILLLIFQYPKYFVDFSWSMFFVSVLFIYLKLSVVTSIVVFFSAICTSSFVTLIFSVCVYIVGETIEEVIFYLKASFAMQDIVIASTLKKSILILSYIAPNLSVFDFKIEAAHGIFVPMSRLVTSFGYGMTYIFLVLMFSSWIFKRREFN